MVHLSVVTEITDRPLDSWDRMGWDGVRGVLSSNADQVITKLIKAESYRCAGAEHCGAPQHGSCT